MKRQSVIKRNTSETMIEVDLTLEGEGIYEISTGIGFFDHMLNLFARHGMFSLKVKAEGDLFIDSHHTVEDVGIVLGQAIKEALGDKSSIKRYGTEYVPMDECLSMCSIDLSGRPYLVLNGELGCGKIGDMDMELVEEFFKALAFNAGMTLHLNLLYGKNRHHIVESMFKAFGRALKKAIEIDERINGVMSTKGVL
jgi:imidazoleglycerol-phosphate dehydratase